jgi:hypothetical protein
LRPGSAEVIGNAQACKACIDCILGSTERASKRVGVRLDLCLGRGASVGNCTRVWPAEPASPKREVPNTSLRSPNCNTSPRPDRRKRGLRRSPVQPTPNCTKWPTLSPLVRFPPRPRTWTRSRPGFSAATAESQLRPRLPARCASRESTIPFDSFLPGCSDDTRAGGRWSFGVYADRDRAWTGWVGAVLE